MTCKSYFFLSQTTSRCENNDGQCIPRLLSPTLICVCFEIFWMFCIFVSVSHLIIIRMPGDELSAGLITGVEGQMQAALTITKHLCWKLHNESQPETESRTENLKSVCEGLILLKPASRWFPFYSVSNSWLFTTSWHLWCHCPGIISPRSALYPRIVWGCLDYPWYRRSYLLK